MCKMKRVLDQIIGTYLRKTKKQDWVMHGRMLDFMCCYFGNKDALVRGILRYAYIEVVNERIQLESINDQFGKYIIVVSRKYEHDYFERIKHDLKRGKVNQCFSNAQMKLLKYRVSFLKVLKSIENDHIFDQHTLQDIIITSCFRGYYNIVMYFISKDVNLNKGFSHYTPLTAACNGGSDEIVQLIIDKGCDVNQVDGMLDTSLTAACKRGYTKIVQLLIDNGGDINQVNGMLETPLTSVCSYGNDEIFL